ncbi:PE family protein, partial [Mycobacterium gordonae]
MTFMVVSPEMVAAAASDVAGIGSTISAANAAAAQSTTGLVSAAADEVSHAIAALFSGHAVGYQEFAGQAAVLHEQFVHTLSAGAASYATAEALNVGPLQPVLDLINLPTQALLGRPLIGNGTDGAPGT